jgi:hypothetical protein
MNFTVGFSNEIKALKKQDDCKKYSQLKDSDFLFSESRFFSVSALQNPIKINLH